MANFDYKTLMAEAQASGASTTYDPLPEGPYFVKVEKAEATNSKAGDPQLVVTFVVTDGPHVNRKLWHRMTFKPGNGIGLAINFRQLDVLGASTILESGGSLAQVAGFLLNKQAIAVVKQREWDGKIQNDVKDLKKSTQTAPTGFAVPSAFVPPTVFVPAIPASTTVAPTGTPF